MQVIVEQAFSGNLDHVKHALVRTTTLLLLTRSLADLRHDSGLAALQQWPLAQSRVGVPTIRIVITFISIKCMRLQSVLMQDLFVDFAAIFVRVLVSITACSALHVSFCIAGTSAAFIWPTARPAQTLTSCHAMRRSSSCRRRHARMRSAAGSLSDVVNNSASFGFHAPTSLAF